MDEAKNRGSEKQIFPKSQLIPEIVEKPVPIETNNRGPTPSIETIDLRKSRINVTEIPNSDTDNRYAKQQLLNAL
jgi:hypothetical protein